MDSRRRRARSRRALPPMRASFGFFVEKRGHPHQRGIPVDRDFVRRERFVVVHEAFLRRATCQTRRLHIRILEPRVGSARDRSWWWRRIFLVGLLRPEAMMRMQEG